MLRGNPTIRNRNNLRPLVGVGLAPSTYWTRRPDTAEGPSFLVAVDEELRRDQLHISLTSNAQQRCLICVVD